ncbi:MAG: adenosyl-hopene transferase HpnH [Actinobacteria bacterium]|nr:adenosyl-hopene transferase HpnH [Actinomycetota bacterium]
MIYKFGMTASLSRYIAKNLIRGRKRFPFVLMLEPILRCNLSCAGCGRIREYRDYINELLSIEECISSAREAGAPVVSITGGEPLLHPDIVEIVKGLLEEKFFVYLCTNGLLLGNFVTKLKPHPRLSFVLHIDGLAATHDAIARREGVFENTIDVIRRAKKLGFEVRTNTTIYKNSSMDEILELFSILESCGVDGMIVSPAFSYQEVRDELFLSKEDVHRMFTEIYQNKDGIRLYNTPIYWEFLTGSRDLRCTPWGSPTRNVKGWKSPCYLITDGHYDSYEDMMNQTRWEKYGSGNDPRCADCMVHSGYEASAIFETGKDIRNLWKMMRWNLFS